jgi:CRISPR/Cas system-associated endoribonuclease Cas2
MLILVSYDVQVMSLGGTRRLRRIARACQDYGQRVQFSVFEIEVAPDHASPPDKLADRGIDKVGLDKIMLADLGEFQKHLRRVQVLSVRDGIPHQLQPIAAEFVHPFFERLLIRSEPKMWPRGLTRCRSPAVK